MIFVDHIIGYIVEKEFLLEMTWEAAVIRFSLIITAFVIWEIVLLLSDPKKVLRKR